MPRGGFLADNQHRDYPLAPTGTGRPTMVHSRLGPVPLPEDLIVDFACLLGLDAGWSPAASAYLARVDRVGAAATVRIRSGAAGLAGLELAFAAARPGPVDASATAILGGSKPPAPCGDTLLWEGTLVVGDTSTLMRLLADGESLTAAAGALPLEPALAQDLAGTYVRSVNLANVRRTVATPPPGCGTPAPDANADVLVVNATCILGDVALREGYNAAIRQNARDNSLQISAVAGGGAGQPCVEVHLSPSETPPAGSKLLSGGPTCGEVVSSVNGLAATAIALVGSGDRSRVFALADRLVVDLTRSLPGVGSTP